MPALHDMICSRCEGILYDLSITREGTACDCGGGVLEIYWHATPRDAIAFSKADTTVVYEHPQTKKIIYPGRNDVPMPERYQRQGYERRELRSLSQVDSFAKQHNVVSESAHYDRGSGRSYDQS